MLIANFKDFSTFTILKGHCYKQLCIRICIFELFSSNLAESIYDEKSCNLAVIQTFSYNSVFHHSDNESSLHCAVMLTGVTSHHSGAVEVGGHRHHGTQANPLMPEFPSKSVSQP